MNAFVEIMMIYDKKKPNVDECNPILLSYDWGAALLIPCKRCSLEKYYEMRYDFNWIN